MTYEYELNEESKQKYGFTHLLCNGWFGKYADNFNEKWNGNIKVNLYLTDDDIDSITKTAISCKEY